MTNDITGTADTDHEEITNATRAERCHAALANYNDEHDVRANLIDFLTDARHWCDAQGQSIAELDRIAHQHYLAERLAEIQRRA